jgi:hypothetical protein
MVIEMSQEFGWIAPEERDYSVAKAFRQHGLEFKWHRREENSIIT